LAVALSRVRLRRAAIRKRGVGMVWDPDEGGLEVLLASI
jgi:hypothetical protein